MLKLFISMSMQKKLKGFKNLNWRRIIKSVGLIFFVLFWVAFSVFFDFFVCSMIDDKKQTKEEFESRYSEIEEEVSLYEKEIIAMASVYDSNYDFLSENAKEYLSLKFDKVEVSFEKNADSNIIISAEYSGSSNSIDFIIKENKLEKIEDYNLENLEEFNKDINFVKVIACIFWDLFIAFLGLLIFCQLF